jgi:hypothetical protein
MVPTGCLVGGWCAIYVSSLEISDALYIFWFCIVYIASLWPLIGIYTRLTLNRLSSLADVVFWRNLDVFSLVFLLTSILTLKFLIILFLLFPLQLMCLADLEFDYINPFDSSSRINKVIMPEFVLQALLSVLFLLSGHWAMFLLSVPMVYYNYTL